MHNAKIGKTIIITIIITIIQHYFKANYKNKVQGRSSAWTPLPLLSEQNNTSLDVVTTVISVYTANDSVTIVFKPQYNSARA